MKSKWNETDAASFEGSDLAMRVYSSRLLGSDAALVMHGGGNTSVKTTWSDFFGRSHRVLFVKGSGWDLKTIEEPGFTGLRLDETCELATLDELSDIDMTRQLRLIKTDASAPAPSVEAILHAIIPAKFVDHTHADSVVTLTNNPDGEQIIESLYPDCLVLPYVMPGFVLSQQVFRAIRDADLSAYKGIILMHHGVFTFAEDAKEAYDNMIELVDRAEQYINDRMSDGMTEHGQCSKTVDLTSLARIRRAVSYTSNKAQLAMLDDSADAIEFSSRNDVHDISTRGPITPDHVIRTKRIPVVIPAQPSETVDEVHAFVDAYSAYFQRHCDGDHVMLNPAPRFAIWQEHGTIAFGNSMKPCQIIRDIASHTRQAIRTGEALGGWKTLDESDIFQLEYWSLEQAKLATGSAAPKSLQGKIAFVTGACAGIGKATCEALASEGCVVVGIDKDAAVESVFDHPHITGLVCDVTDNKALRRAVDFAVKTYGGMDILVCNAGIFKSGERIESHTDDTWNRTLDVNLTCTRQLLTLAIPYLKLGIDPSIIVVGSRNVSAPGPGAAAYSVSKTGLTQLARVAALELAQDGVRVNVVHPDAVFDTALWTDEALQRSAERYGMTVDEYKTKNLLGTEITSADVGNLIATLAGPTFKATTGAQIPIDGGNDRVI